MEGVSTAYALALFRDELLARGFTDDVACALVLGVAPEEVRASGLAVTLPETEQQQR